MKQSSAWKELGKPVVVVDFDGVIADYSEGFKGVDVFGDPIEGAKEALCELYEMGWYIIIFTTRFSSEKLFKWLWNNKIPFHSINSTNHNPPNTSIKPIATVYLDDRAWPRLGKQYDKETWEQIVKDLRKLYDEQNY